MLGKEDNAITKVLVVGDATYQAFKDELRKQEFEVLEANTLAEIKQLASSYNISLTVFDIHYLNPEGSQPSDFKAGLDVLEELFVSDAILGKLFVLAKTGAIRHNVLAIMPDASFLVIPTDISIILAGF